MNFYLIYLRKIVIFLFIIDRHILAVLHFNLNLPRDKKLNSDNSERLKVSYPKFKNGEATIRSVRVAQNFGEFSVHEQYSC